MEGALEGACKRLSAYIGLCIKIYKIVFLALALFIALELTIKAETPQLNSEPLIINHNSQKYYLGQFFGKRKCPLLPYVNDFIGAAEKYRIDYRLLPGISVIESQCGKMYPRNTNNPFGWQSARVGFKSIPDAIDFITGQLANSKYYAGKTTKRKLASYCPNPEYPSRVMAVMQQIEQK
jgi:hypothetical protein